MIIDGDCHISTHTDEHLGMSADELLKSMDRAGIDKSLIWLKPPYDRNIESENEAIYKAVQRHPERFLGFGWTNPRLGHERALAAVERCLDDYDFHGVKFNGAQDDYLIDQEEVLLLVSEIAKRGKLVAFHVGADFPENTHPTRLANVAARFPDITFLMVHMGGAAFPALDRAAIEVASKVKNIHIIGSAIHERAILNAVNTLGSERLSFGSDMPFFLNHARLALYRAILRDHSPEAVSAVLGGNLHRLLGLD